MEDPPWRPARARFTTCCQSSVKSPALLPGLNLPDQIREKVRQVWRSRPCRSDVFYIRNQSNEGRAMKADAPTNKRRARAGSQRAAQGEPTARITAIYSRRASPNLKEIIIGTHGYSGLKHALVGSTAERVVRHAPCPVLVVRQRAHEFLTPQSTIKPEGRNILNPKGASS